MSTFYVLPNREQLEQKCAEFLRTVLPGVFGEGKPATALADALASLAERQPDVFLVFQDELPAGEPVRQSPMDGLGATAGDRVVEIGDANDLAASATQSGWLRAAA